MSSKLFKLQTIFFLLVLFFCTLSAGEELTPWPTTEQRPRTWVGSHAGQLDRGRLIEEAQGTFTQLGEKIRRLKNWPTPGVVSALAIGGKTYFASSAPNPGGGDTKYPDEWLSKDVKDALAASGNAHKNQQKCAEIMVIESWYRDNPEKHIKDQHPKQIVAVNKNGVLDPCGAGRRADYGCMRFLEKIGFKTDGSEIVTDPSTQCNGGKAKSATSKKQKATSKKQLPKKPSTTRRKHRRSMHELVESMGEALKG